MKRIPISTYRLQLNKNFTLSQVIDIVDYLYELGITDLYLSPLQMAVPGSNHCYDVIDHTRINPEIGTEEDLEALVVKLRSLEMGIILDIVPNHMNILSLDNYLWQDVLKFGKKSQYADYFDIHWDSPHQDLKDKVLLPFLGEPLEESNMNFLVYNDYQFPISENFDYKAFEKLHYRLDYWKRGFTDLNYRRFFEISELACLKQENPNVFNHVHNLIFKWIDKGWIKGLRVDHVDGLKNPKEYLRKLKKKNVFIVVEKILVGDEVLKKDWDIEGTTGYDFMNFLNDLYVDNDLTEIYKEFTGINKSTDEIEIESKKELLQTTMRSEWNYLKNIIPNQYHEILLDYMIHLPVYRTYELEELEEGELKEYFKKNQEAFFSLQQLTGPIMAKGVEDTALYRYYPLISSNEVGSCFGKPQRSFHEFNLQRYQKTPYSFSATTTHDTKRSEDVRARINVLSEIPLEWKMVLYEWHRMNKKFQKENSPDKNEEYLLYQTLVGTWPIEENRIKTYMNKAIKEGKYHTSWIKPNELYEKNLNRFIEEILSPSHPFIKELELFVHERILKPALYNSLSQTLLKITSPGVPDFYQGSQEILLTLVDPDNRNLVDYSRLCSSISEKQVLIKKLLNFRKQNRNFFLEGKYIPLEIDGENSRNVISFSRQYQEKHVIIVTGRYFTNLKWKNTDLILPKEMEFRDIFSEMTIKSKDRKLSIEDLFKNQPFTILRQI